MTAAEALGKREPRQNITAFHTYASAALKIDEDSDNVVPVFQRMRSVDERMNQTKLWRGGVVGGA